MNLALTQDQQLIRESVLDYLAGAYDFNVHLARKVSGKGVDAARWKDVSELGWLGINVNEAEGGIGGQALEAWALMEGIGAHLFIEPVLASAILSAPILAQAAASSSLAREVLTHLLEGKLSVALAYAETERGYDPQATACTASLGQNGQYQLQGRKVLVQDGADATWIIVPARLATSASPAGELGLFLVRGDAPGVTRERTQMIDGSYAADVNLNAVSVDASALILADAQPVLTAAMRRGIAAQCAEAVGAMRAAIALCRGYMHERRQFGRSLVDFQALQHRFVDMTIAYERALSMSLLAAALINEAADDALLEQELSRVKVVVGRAARKVGGDAIQIHGGMGMTMEYPVGHYYRKLLLCDFQFGTADEHLALLMNG